MEEMRRGDPTRSRIGLRLPRVTAHATGLAFVHRPVASLSDLRSDEPRSGVKELIAAAEVLIGRRRGAAGRGRGVRGTTTVGSHAQTGVGVESVAIQTSIGSGNRVGLWPRLGEGPFWTDETRGESRGPDPSSRSASLSSFRLARTPTFRAAEPQPMAHTRRTAPAGQRADRRSTTASAFSPGFRGQRDPGWPAVS
jgi:hypothetical protein